jgi:hypothetical protein
MLARLLGDLNFHALIDEVIRATGIRGGRTMRDHAKSAGRVLDFIGVALAAPFFKRYCAARSEIVQTGVSAVLGLVSAFRLRYGD